MLLFLAALPLSFSSELLTVQEELSEQIPGYVWSCNEIGTGNINYIYLAQSGDQKIIVKKDLDFARINPEEFPLPVDRLLYEYRAYKIYEKYCAEFLPKIHFFNFEKGMLAMEYLYPHIPLRKGLIEGRSYPLVAEHLGTFLARSLYFTSCYHLSNEEWRENVSFFAGNRAMRKIIIDLNFTDPFYGSPLNDWSSPELDEIVEDIQMSVRGQVDRLKEKFLSCPEALSHGDLHTGSILVTETDTKIIDTEFASYAPIAFDIGMLLANFSIATFAADAHSIDKDGLTAMTGQIWDVFEREFRLLWNHSEIDVNEKLEEIWSDTLGFMGIEIIRRTIGVAHNADFETIADRDLKVAAERNALGFAKELLLGGSRTLKKLKKQE